MANGEQQGNGEVRRGRIRLSSGPRTVEYTAVNGEAVFEGDIILGTVDELEPPRLGEVGSEGVGITGDEFRWPNCTVPYTIDPALPKKERVTDAIAHWEAKTNYRFVQRTNEPDYVTFVSGSGCSSAIGKRGGQQYISLGSDCTTGNAIHEIGHTIGLWHEQSREDRDKFVRIVWQNISQEKRHNFNQQITDGDDIGPYDYASIMHYSRTAFSVDGNDTIVPVDPAVEIGQRNGLSEGDIAAANSLCKQPDESVVDPKKIGRRRAVRT